ncbi:ArsR/SmtB family transcription factor [Alicyclobacillus acidiphilus]|uniref:ArsR/SmtB family transcription factor n=1 Tax=Alicyclobacillus acidiphilus TaxID=182455 RepID=UPI00082E1D2E|nr:ArsR family transcriptional regulator [Alicyclobacillus acidiphilus]
MKTLDFGVPSDYTLRFSSSSVFECALSIAAFTREEIYDKLDHSLEHFRSMRDRMSDTLHKEVSLSGHVHTWRSLLFLAHQCPHVWNSPWEQHVQLFLNWIQENEHCLTKLAAPYLGEIYVSELDDALAGNQTAQRHLIEVHTDNPVIHLNLRYLFSVKSHDFLEHLVNLLTYWYKEIEGFRMADTMMALEQDRRHAEQLATGLTSRELIRLLTRGSELQPHPGVNTLWLVPQFAYRPFTIINHLAQCVVYYYPVGDEFLPWGTTHAQMNQAAALHKALGDVQRLRLLTLLRQSPKSLAEITHRLNATKSNIHHHLTLLRTADLVQVQDGIYSLNHEAISRVGTELRALLGAQQT